MGRKMLHPLGRCIGYPAEKPHAKNLVTEFVFREKKSKHLEGSFFYPYEGFGTIAHELAQACGSENLHLSNRVTKITTDGRKITSIEINGKKTAAPGLVVSTLPVTFLLKILTPGPPVDILNAALELKFRHLKMVAFLLNRKSVNKAATIYFPGKEFIFTRCYEPRNRSSMMSPDGKTSIVAEIPFSDGDNISELCDEELIANAQENLLSARLFAKHEIIGTNTFVIKNAYPVLKKGYEQHYQKIAAYLAQFENLYISGRGGRFEYSWAHNQMRWAFEIVDKITKS